MMKDLIAKLEAAPEAQQELVFLEVLELARNRNWINDDTHERARQWVINGAYLSAAEVRVPEGWHVSHAYWTKTAATFNLTKEVGVYAEARDMAAPALALTIAALKAHDGIEMAAGETSILKGDSK